MESIIIILTCIICFGMGWIGRGYKSNHVENDSEESEILVSRAKPNMRNQLKPYTVAYDIYKTKQGLYEPQAPRRKGTFDV
jgi:hypothetical protein